LSLGPPWLVVHYALPSAPAPVEPDLVFIPEGGGGPVVDATDVVPADAAAAPTPAPETARWSLTELLALLVPWLAAAYAAGAALLVGRWLLGHVALWRLLRTASPAPSGLAQRFAAMVPFERTVPRLLVSNRVRVPLSCGLLRPTVVLPSDLCAAD